MQKTYILDTNIYGELLIEPNSDELIQKIKTIKHFFIYGVDVIEKELSETPSHVKYGGKMTREVLFTLFDSLVDEIIKVSPIAKYLAEEYHKKYRELAKSGKYRITKEKYDKKNLKIDFQIIAIASIKSVDIIVSADKRTMFSQLAKDIYVHINKINSLRTPELLEYEKFKEVYLK